MNVEALIAALALPPEARVDKRVPKTLLVDQGAPTTSDKRYIQAGVDELHWIAALKPGNIGVPAYRDSECEYLEIAVVAATFTPKAKVPRLIELVHRSIPYPVLLVASHSPDVSITLATKRLSQGRAGATVTARPVFAASFGASSEQAALDLEARFLESLALSAQPRKSLQALYEGWIDCLESLHFARITGVFQRAESLGAVALRRFALVENERITSKIARLRDRVAKEKQLNRRVEMNLEIKRLEARLLRFASQHPASDVSRSEDREGSEQGGASVGEPPGESREPPRPEHRHATITQASFERGSATS